MPSTKKTNTGLISDQNLNELATEEALNSTYSDSCIINSQDSSSIEASHLKTKQKKLNCLFSLKELFDRMGFGLTAHQFINIFFFMIGGSTFLVGVINGLKEALSLMFSSFLRFYTDVRKVSLKIIAISGLIFGFSFLFMGLAIKSKNLPLFSVALLISGLGIVTYGELYSCLLKQSLKPEKRSFFLKNITHYGLLITSLFFILSGFILDKFGMTEKVFSFNFFNYFISLPLTGYLIIFEFTAFALILSAHMLFKISSPDINKTKPCACVLNLYFYKMKNHMGLFVKDKRLLCILLSGVLVATIQTLGNSYYGYFLFSKFKNLYFGSFTNIALIFVFAMLCSLISQKFIVYLKNKVGVTPLFVFGALLFTLMPLTLVFNQYIYAILVANALAIIGLSMISISQNEMLAKLMGNNDETVGIHSFGLFSLIPYLILVPLGAMFAQFYGLMALFKLMVLVLLLLIVPLNFVLVWFAEKQKL
jgi:hypothetical protein